MGVDCGNGNCLCYDEGSKCAATAKAMCCRYNRGGVGAAATLASQTSDLYLDCSQDPPVFAARTEAGSVPKRCTSVEAYTLSEIGAALTGAATVDPTPAAKSPASSS